MEWYHAEHLSLLQEISRNLYFLFVYVNCVLILVVANNSINNVSGASLLHSLFTSHPNVHTTPSKGINLLILLFCN